MTPVALRPWRPRRSSPRFRSSFTRDATGPQSESREIQLQLGNAFYDEGRYDDALDAYERRQRRRTPDQLREARAG